MLEKTGVYVLRALALRLGLDEFYFDNYAKDGNSILSTTRLLPQSQQMQYAPLLMVISI
jgi:isopenicillin N synthase-like dioxygenase